MPNRSWTLILLSVAALATLVIGASNYSALERSDDLRLWIFDVGQGDAELIDTPNGEQILIDGGPDQKILQRLAQALPLTDKDLNLIIVTHNHSDHLAGIVEVLKHYRVENIWISGAIHTTDTYRRFLQQIKEKNIPTEIVRAGKRVQFGSLSGIVTFPFDEQKGELPDNQHDASIITHWQYGAVSFLLTGDAEDVHERNQLERGVAAPAQILKVGHHGSRTSSSRSYLAKIKPEVAIISVGIKNRYSHPHQQTLDTFAELKIPVVRTDRDGTIRFSITESGYFYRTGL